MAIDNGMSASEALKFKTRLEGLIKPRMIELQKPIIEPIDDRSQVELSKMKNSQTNRS